MEIMMNDVTNEKMQLPGNLIDLTEPVIISSLRVVDLSDELLDSMPSSPIIVDLTEEETADETSCSSESSCMHKVVFAANAIDLTDEEPLQMVQLELPVDVIPNESEVVMSQTSPPKAMEATYHVMDLTDETEDEELEAHTMVQVVDLTLPPVVVNVNKETEVNLNSKTSCCSDGLDVTEELERLSPQIVQMIGVRDSMEDSSSDIDIEGNESCSSEVDAEVSNQWIDSLDVDQLNEQLQVLLNQISILENSALDFSDLGNELHSSFILIREYKVKACQIYERIVEISGEPETTVVKVNIRFDATPFVEFNQKLQRMVNKSGYLPDPYDVLKWLKKCNDNYDYQLSDDDSIDLVEKVLREIGRELQKHRKADLDEAFSYYTNDQVDPALYDVDLRSKLDWNKSEQRRKKT